MTQKKHFALKSSLNMAELINAEETQKRISLRPIFPSNIPFALSFPLAWLPTVLRGEVKCLYHFNFFKLFFFIVYLIR